MCRVAGVLLVLAPAVAGAGTLEGIVRDDSGRPVAFANVLCGPAPETWAIGVSASDWLRRETLRAIADSTGHWRMDDVPAGRRSLQVRHLAIREWNSAVEVPGEATVEVAVTTVSVKFDPGPIEIPRTRSGRVEDALTRAPLADVFVSSWPARPSDDGPPRRFELPRGHQLVRTNASGEYSGRQAPEAWAHFGRAGYEPFLTRVSSHSPTEGGSPGALLTLLLPAPRALLASVPDSSDLMQWVSAWRSVLPGLAIDDFRGVRHGEIGAAELDYVEHLHALGLDLPAWRRFLKLSPDGRWGIDAWLYNIGNRGGHVSLERGPDTTVGLVEVETGKCRRLLSGGPALEVQVVSWIGPHTVALGGRSEDPRTSSPHLALWVYDAEARTAVSYRGPECTPAEAASVTWDPER